MTYQFRPLKDNELEIIIASGGNLRGADLGYANLYGANLEGADLRYANLGHADLRGSNLSRADLSGAYLYGANLSRANLSRANLYGANLSNITMNWLSHNLIGARLHQLALRENHNMLNHMACTIMGNTQWCWEKFIELFSGDIWTEARQMAIEEMKTWVKEGDNLPSGLKGLIDG